MATEEEEREEETEERTKDLNPVSRRLVRGKGVWLEVKGYLEGPAMEGLYQLDWQEQGRKMRAECGACGKKPSEATKYLHIFDRRLLLYLL